MICFLEDDDPPLNEHQIAWMERDWDKVKKLVEEFKPEPKNGLFEALNNINYIKDENVSVPDNYSAFMINSMLSSHVDCIAYAHYANMFLKGLPDRFHYDYMIKSIPKSKNRFSKSSKLDDALEKKYALKLIMKFYNVNHFKAYEYYELMVKKDNLKQFLKRAKGLATDEFLKTVSKSAKDIKEMKKL